jgi:hypothetical protein
MKKIFGFLTVIIFTIISFSCSGPQKSKGDIKIQLIQTLENTQTFPKLEAINNTLKVKKSEPEIKEDNSMINDTTKPLAERMKGSSEKPTSYEDFANQNPLFAILSPNIYQVNNQQELMPSCFLGYVLRKDTAKLNNIFYTDSIRAFFHPTAKFNYVEFYSEDGTPIERLYITTENSRKENLNSEDIEYIKVTEQEHGSGISGLLISEKRYNLSMKMRGTAISSINSLITDKNALLVATTLGNYTYAIGVNKEDANGLIPLAKEISKDELKSLKADYGDLIVED